MRVRLAVGGKGRSSQPCNCWRKEKIGWEMLCSFACFLSNSERGAREKSSIVGGLDI